MEAADLTSTLHRRPFTFQAEFVMPTSWCWEDLPPDLVRSIGDIILDLECYASARGACTAWRCALAPPCPSMLLVPDYLSSSTSAASIPIPGRTFQLWSTPYGSHCVGSSSGWLALSVPSFGGQSTLSLFNPVTAAKIALPPLILDSSTMRVSKIVLAPSPAHDDFAAAAICGGMGMDRLAYVTAGARRWAVLDPVPLTHGDHLTDLVYHEKEGKVYYLTGYGDVHVLLLPERRRREPFTDDEPSSQPVIIPMIRRPELWPADAQRVEIDRRMQTQQMHAMIHRRSSMPDLNAPAKVEHLLSIPFDPAISFAPPYNKILEITSAKNLVFCGGNLYQIWRNASCKMTTPEGGGRRHIAENEVFVLRYYPDRQPCWDAVADLGGYSVFVGRNNAVSVYAQDVLGLKANCVYWIGGSDRDKGMVFDMATRNSTPCPPTGVAPQITVCWYFLGDMVDNCNFINGGKRVLSDPSESSG